MKLSNRVYDILKWIATILPARPGHPVFCPLLYLGLPPMGSRW